MGWQRQDRDRRIWEMAGQPRFYEDLGCTARNRADDCKRIGRPNQMVHAIMPDGEWHGDSYCIPCWQHMTHEEVPAHALASRGLAVDDRNLAIDGSPLDDEEE
jgi:hypothetical protein